MCVYSDANGDAIRDEDAERREREEVYKRLARNAFTEKRKKYRHVSTRIRLGISLIERAQSLKGVRWRFGEEM